MTINELVEILERFDGMTEVCVTVDRKHKGIKGISNIKKLTNEDGVVTEENQVQIKLR